MSANSLTNFPSSTDVVSKREKKESISSEAEIADERNEDTLERKSASFAASFRNKLAALSVTALCRNRRACS